jgi:hypothetical protein
MDSTQTDAPQPRSPVAHSRPHTFALMAIVVFGFLSFLDNRFGVVDERWFNAFEVESEQLVLDGLVHAVRTDATAVLGRYSRPDEPDAYARAREFYAAGNHAGEFERYESQYGLQARVMQPLSSALRALGVKDELRAMHALLALAMAVAIGAMAHGLARLLPPGLALAFAATLTLSPWMTVMARNLYWVSFTWYLPFIAAVYLAAGSYRSGKTFATLLAILFATYLLKLLCGYEFVTSIGLAASVPLVYAGVRDDQRWQAIAARVLANGVVLVLALLAAAALHAGTSAGGVSAGWSKVAITAEKRLSSATPMETARRACDADAKCEKKIAQSLAANPWEITARYFRLNEALPWVSAVRLDEQERLTLRLALGLGDGLGRGPRQDMAPVPQTEPTTLLGTVDAALQFVLIVLDRAAFPTLLIVLGAIFMHIEPALRWSALFALGAPLSWFFLAKGHSAIHMHLNHVLWSLPFVPWCVMAVVSGFLNRRRLGATATQA